MKRALQILSFLLLFLTAAPSASAQRTEQTLSDGWRFFRGDVSGASAPSFDDSRWEVVSVPHDWAIAGPFDRAADLQNVAVTQNGETTPTVKTGRTGGLHYAGPAWYRRTFTASTDKGKRTVIVVDGAMSNAHVYVNGREVGFWPYGYNSFFCDASDAVRRDGQPNLLAVRVDNHEQSSRWYCGAGLYRNVHVIETDAVHVPVWGTLVTTQLADSCAVVTLKTTVEGAGADEQLTLYTEIIDGQGKVVAAKNTRAYVAHGQPVQQNFTVDAPQLWSPEAPNLYLAVTRIYSGGALRDTYSTRFGIRSLELLADHGFRLNGQPRKFQGVCNHHDLGPLGAAVNRSALRHQLEMLKDMGCDAVRTAHNMPAPELVELCDEMGLMLMLEPFDEWDIAKCDSGYHIWFDKPARTGGVGEGALNGEVTWAEADVAAMVRHYRNNPSVVMWSVGNEVPTQGSDEGYKVASFLRDVCRKLDPTRPVTCGMDQVDAVLDKGFAAVLDVPGFNYRAHRYEEAYERLPQGVVLGSETASTVSSRGVYKFPVAVRDDAMYADHQSSSYDVEHCWWSNIPDLDFANADDHDWEIGQFVWTGFDYLGEPTPYDTDAWPSHSSLFGIIDLASIPKDRYWLYRSVWNRDSHTLHILPHWTWPGRKGKTTPVCVYTDAPEAELFVNGVSQGVQRKLTAEEAYADLPRPIDKSSRAYAEQTMKRYRLMWPDVKYAPGELKAVAHFADGTQWPAYVHTAGKPHHIEVLGQDGHGLEASSDDRYYLTVRIVDKDGNLCPDASDEISLSVSGNAAFVACANGDPTCTELFQTPRMHAFHGQLTAIIRCTDSPATTDDGVNLAPAVLTASAKGLKSGSARVAVGTYRRPGFIKGADIGWVTEMESKGESVCNADGEPTEMTQLMKDYGCEAVRCRVWLDPSAHDGWCSLDDVIAKSLRAKALGMDVMIDFHYSDWWCDPAKQPVPRAWSGKTAEEIKPLLRDYTVSVLETLKAHGVEPKWVQVGNETTYGFLWSVREDPATGWPDPAPDGKNVITEAIARMDRPGHFTAHYEGVPDDQRPPCPTPENLTPGARAYAELFATGYDAVKSVFPDAQVIVHLDDGFDSELYDWNLGILRAGGAKWDIIGMSLYTYWAINEGKRTESDKIVDECIDNINHLWTKFGTPSMLVEVGMDAMNPDDGSRLLKRILGRAQMLTDGHCLGAFYWEPACRPSTYRLGAFDEAGRPTEIMNTWKNN